MKRVNKLALSNALLAIGLLLLTAPAFAGSAKNVATVTIPPAPGLYATEPQPLTVNQCGQCHPGAFTSLKKEGGKHQFDCQQCHKAFHAYNPKKGIAAYDALMPKCSSCHADPHGKAITDCASCHANPHAPRKGIAMGPQLINACTTCHAGPKQQLVQFPSKHTKVACQTCHTSHGYKPSCFSCHKPNHGGKEVTGCAKCHPVHKPLQIAYEKDVPATTCGACHSKVYTKWQKTPSKHGKVGCATCHHTKHRLIPQCKECHGLPHKKEIHDRFPKCLSCHLDVHDPPVKQGNAKP